MENASVLKGINIKQFVFFTFNLGQSISFSGWNITLKLQSITFMDGFFSFSASDFSF